MPKSSEGATEDTGKEPQPSFLHCLLKLMETGVYYTAHKSTVTSSLSVCKICPLGLQVEPLQPELYPTPKWQQVLAATGASQASGTRPDVLPHFT